MPSIEQQIEYLCSCEFSDYVSLKNQRRLEGGVMPSRRPLLRSLSEIEAEQDEMARCKRRFQEFENYKNDLRAKAPAEIQALVEQKKAETANRQQQELLARIVAEKEKFQPDWGFWLHMPDVELWQACALSIGIDPDKMKVEPNSWLAGTGTDHGPFFTLTSFPSKAVEDDFNKRLRLAKAHHGASGQKRVSLSMFVTWALSVPLFKEMPDELGGLSGSKLLHAPSGMPSALPQNVAAAKQAEQTDGAYARQNPDVENRQGRGAREWQEKVLQEHRRRMADQTSKYKDMTRAAQVNVLHNFCREQNIKNAREKELSKESIEGFLKPKKSK